MSYLKRERSKVLNTARKRINALRDIDPDMVLGRDLTIEKLAREADELEELLHKYNQVLAEADNLRNALREKERSVKDSNERIFMGVKTLYGRDSDEYEIVGGTRKSTIDFNPHRNKSAD